jgi:hypothetical protein
MVVFIFPIKTREMCHLSTVWINNKINSLCHKRGYEVEKTEKIGRSNQVQRNPFLWGTRPLDGQENSVTPCNPMTYNEQKVTKVVQFYTKTYRIMHFAPSTSSIPTIPIASFAP